MVSAGLAAVGIDPIRQGLALFQRPAAQGHFRSGIGQPLADGRTDAARRAGDHDRFSLQAKDRLEIRTVIHTAPNLSALFIFIWTEDLPPYPR